jgi:dihydropteroate synthase
LFVSFGGHSFVRESQIVLEDVEKNSSLAVLKYLYSRKERINSGSGVALLYTSTRFGVPELAARVECDLVADISTSNFFDLWKIADECNLSNLRRHCLSFLIQ